MNEEGNNENCTNPYHTGGTNHTCQAQDKDKNQTGFLRRISYYRSRIR